MVQLLLKLATQLGIAIGATVVSATVRYLEKKSLIKHFQKKIDKIRDVTETH